MNRTKIEWVKNPDGTLGYTWNPLTGCLNGCPYCYARKLANGRLKTRYLANENYPTSVDFRNGVFKPDVEALYDPFYPRFWEDRLDDVKRGYHFHDWSGVSEFGAKARGVFVCDMSDLFGIGIPKEWTRKVLDAVSDHDNHQDRFYLLTKQPQNLSQFSPFPENCWVGVTATNRQMLLEARKVFDSSICSSGIKAKIKYISFEPLLESVICDHKWETDTHQPAFSRRRIMPTTRCVKCGQGERWGSNSELIGSDGKPIVDWVIIGAQTNPYKPPKIEWVEEIVQACDKAGVKVFLKDNLRPLLVDALVKRGATAKLIDRKQFFVHSAGYGGDLRQEIPNG